MDCRKSSAIFWTLWCGGRSRCASTRSVGISRCSMPSSANGCRCTSSIGARTGAFRSGSTRRIRFMRRITRRSSSSTTQLRSSAAWISRSGGGTRASTSPTSRADAIPPARHTVRFTMCKRSSTPMRRGRSASSCASAGCAPARASRARRWRRLPTFGHMASSPISMTSTSRSCAPSRPSTTAEPCTSYASCTSTRSRAPAVSSSWKTSTSPRASSPTRSPPVCANPTGRRSCSSPTATNAAGSKNRPWACCAPARSAASPTPTRTAAFARIFPSRRAPRTGASTFTARCWSSTMNF